MTKDARKENSRCRFTPISIAIFTSRTLKFWSVPNKGLSMKKPQTTILEIGRARFRRGDSLNPGLFHRSLLSCAVVCMLLTFCAKDSEAAEKGGGVRIVEAPDRLRVEINGAPFTEYFFKDVPRPFCYPLLGPGGLPLTRNWPMKDTPGEEHDHKHHRSLWFTRGQVNGSD